MTNPGPRVRPGQAQVDQSMVTHVATVLIDAFARTHAGKIPSNEDLAAFIRSMSPAEILAIVRTPHAMRSLEVQLRNDADVFRWVKTISERK